MFEQVRNRAIHGVDAQGMNNHIAKMGSGKFAQSSVVTSMKQGANGRPVQEKYQTKATGAFGQGNRVTERHQMYENSGSQHQKMAHERMINNQGRKVVHERLGGAGGEERSQNLFRNIAENDAAGFD